MDPLDEILELLKQFSGTMGIAAKSVKSDQAFFLNEDTVFPTASCIKVPVLVELCYQVIQGKISLKTQIPLRQKDKVPGTGVLKDLQPGIKFSIKDLASLSITISDNSAANILIDLLGIDAINAHIQQLGMKDTYLGTKFVFNDPKKNVGSPVDFFSLLSKIWQKSILDNKCCEWILSLMGRQQYVDFIPRYLPYNRFADEYGLSQQISIANKVGMLSGVVNDMAIIQIPNLTYIIVIFTKECKDLSFNPDNEGAIAIAQVSMLIHDFFIQQGDPG
jgi:beta-lactamase class A